MIEATQVAYWLGGRVLNAAWSAAIKRIFAKRLTIARQILIEELERGDANLVDVSDQDEAAAMVFEYADAAQKGTARRNLRALAQILAGALATPPIYADAFLRWSKILADLSREEVVVLAKFYEGWQLPQEDESMRSFKTFEKVRDELMRTGVVQDATDLTSALQALQRTGLIMSKSVLGGLIYFPTRKLDQLMALIQIEAVLQEPDR